MKHIKIDQIIIDCYIKQKKNKKKDKNRVNRNIYLDNKQTNNKTTKFYGSFLSIRGIHIEKMSPK